MAGRILHCHEEREDAIHGVFLKLFDDNSLTVDESTLKSYLCKSVINASINIRNRSLNVSTHHMNIARSTAQAYSMDILAAEKKDIIRNAIETNLPEQCKIVFKKKLYEELKNDEIATELNISIKTVKNHYTKALKLIHAHLKGLDYFNDLGIVAIVIKIVASSLGLSEIIFVMI